MNPTKILFPALIIAATLISCVSQERYNTSQELQAQYYDEARECADSLNKAGKRIKDLEERVRVLSAQKQKVEEDTLRLVEELERVQESCSAMQQKNQELLEKLKTSKSAEEVAALMKEIQGLQDELVSREDALFKAERKLKDQQKELEIQNARVTELTAMLDSTENQMENLKTVLKNALTNYEGLAVSSKNGKIYVSLDEKLLFRSGRWDVDSRGAAAIRELSEVLASQPGLNITIEGHTDDVPYNGGSSISDNWDLSAKRATAITRILLENKGIDPSRVSASGRSQYCPVDSANTSEARAKNRRSEIILTPDLQQFIKLLE